MSRLKFTGVRWILASLVVALAVALGAPAAASAQDWSDHLDATQYELTEFSTWTNDMTAGARANSGVQFKFKMGDVGGTLIPYGRTQRVDIFLPPGLIGNPTNFRKCPLSEFMAGFSTCAFDTQVGVANIDNLHTAPAIQTPVFLLQSGPDEPALLGIVITVSMYAYIHVKALPDGQLIAYSDELPPGFPIKEFEIELWGVPADHGTGAPRLPFMTNGTECETVPLTRITTFPWERASQIQHGSSALAGPLEDCESLEFEPSMAVGASESRAGSPSGLAVEINVPQNNDPDGRATAHVRDVELTLPEGMRVSPAAAEGLDACAPEQIKLETPGRGSCPESSKLGSVTVDTPLLEEPMEGTVYQAKPYDNPFGSLLALYIEMTGAGQTIKLAGEVETDPETGQVKSTFRNNPQLPFDRMVVELDGGNRAPLVTPSACGKHEAEVRFIGWNGAVVDDTSAITVDRNCERPAFKPEFEAGTASPVAGGSSTFSMRLARPDGADELRSIEAIQMPEGLLGRVGSVDVCGEAAADAGACGAGSRIGFVQAALGAGSSPLWVPQGGKAPTGVYLAGPYRGAPYSLSIVVPAQAGPFDLGRVVVRAGLHVDERTARISSGVEETRIYGRDGQLKQVLPKALPRILEGVVLDQREVRVIVDRDKFMLNPTSCAQKQISAEAVSYTGTRVPVSSRFRAVDCARLGFQPRLRARILDRGRKSTLRSFHPRTRFTVTPRPGDANIGGARVALPSSTILDQSNIGTTCTRAQMAERNCPAKALVGYAKAWSPVLRRPIEGPVYLAANGGVRPLPDLAAILDGEVRIVLQGEISTLRTRGKARLQNTFRVVPDAPVSRFVLTMRGGKNTGLLVNSTDLCRSRERGVAVFRGQNGRVSRSALRLAPSFKGCGKVRRQAARRAMR